MRWVNRIRKYKSKSKIIYDALCIYSVFKYFFSFLEDNYLTIISEKLYLLLKIFKNKISLIKL